MALIETQDQITYIGIFDGKLEIKVPDGTPNSKTRQTNTGNTITYQNYRAVAGYITDIKKHIKEWEGKKFVSLNIYMADMDQKYILQLPYKSQAATCFFNVMEGIHYAKKVEFSVGNKVLPNGKVQTSLFVKQGGDTLKWKYTKNNPGNKPAWKAVTIDGENKWDRTEEIKFFENIIINEIKPKLAQQTIPQLDATGPGYFPTAEPADTEQGQDIDDVDDLPF